MGLKASAVDLLRSRRGRAADRCHRCHDRGDRSAGRQVAYARQWYRWAIIAIREPPLSRLYGTLSRNDSGGHKSLGQGHRALELVFRREAGCYDPHRAWGPHYEAAGGPDA